MKYVSEFVKNEDGVEMFEYVMMIGVAAILIGAIVAVFSKSKDSAEKAGTALSKAFETK